MVLSVRASWCFGLGVAILASCDSREPPPKLSAPSTRDASTSVDDAAPGFHGIDAMPPPDGSAAEWNELHGGLHGEPSANEGPGLVQRSRTPVPSPISLGLPTVHGGLDAAIVRRHVRRELAKLVSCYERELLRKPRIGGTVTLQLVIDREGRVGRVNATGVDSYVARCMASVVEAIRFPSPRDGKVVHVSYPIEARPPGR
jgi:hypothetical protein